MTKTEEITGCPIKQFLEKRDSLNHEQQQIVIAFHAKLETQESWKSEVFKEVLAEDVKPSEAFKDLSEDLIRIQEMLTVSRRN